MTLILTQIKPSHFVKLSSLQQLADKDSFIVTVAKARNSVRQIDASVLKQRDFVTAGATAVSHVKTRISGVSILLLIHSTVFILHGM